MRRDEARERHRRRHEQRWAEARERHRRAHDRRSPGHPPWGPDRWHPGPWGGDARDEPMRGTPPWARKISPQMYRRVLLARERRDAPSGVVALVTAVIHVGGARIALGHLPEGPALALLLAGPLALVLRKRAPVVALVVALAAALAYVLPAGAFAPVFVAPIFALVQAVQAGKRGAAGWSLVGAYLVFVFAGRLLPDHLHVVPWTRALAVAGGVWAAYLFAEGKRARSGQMAALARIVEEEERAAAEQQRRQASEERLRIAQELHDVLGHHLSLINVRAGVGLHIMDEHPEEARASLTAIKEASAEALREVRAVLASLRLDDDEAAAPRAPTAGLGALDALLASADPPVPLQVEGTARDLPPEVDRAAYRIMQEALTNVRRHAGPAARATAAVRYLPDTVEIGVCDDGVGVPEGKIEAGNGLAGMRERAAALGGTLRAGPRAGGGFEVVAVLPVPGGDE